MPLLNFRTISAAVLMFQIATASAGAQAVADNMTCQQAIRYYEQNGRISKMAGRSTIPVYQGVSASRRNELRCSPVGVFFKTTDNPRCPVAYKCPPGGRGP